MDAPPEKMDIQPYIHARSVLSMLNVPEIYAFDLGQGFMELQDLGSVTYMQALQQETVPDVTRLLLLEAVDSLIEMQRHSQSGLLPAYDHALLQREVELFPSWFADRHVNRPFSAEQRRCWDQVIPLLLDRALAEPRVFVHRDCIVRNLMLSEGRPGVLDFQDAVIGPITYDLVSLLRDCYIAWPEERVENWVRQYHQRLLDEGLVNETNVERFLHWFDMMGLQRHVKVLGVFSRLNLRDGKAGYLRDIPRTLNYMVRVCEKHPEIADFSAFLQDGVIQQTYSLLGQPS